MDKQSKRRLQSGNIMPIIGLGTWQLKNDTEDTVAYALNNGYILIDTSSDYGTQPGVGQGIRKSKKKRSDIYLTTKVEETDDAYKRTLSNLKELKMDYVDLMLIHRPPSSGAGENLWEGLIKAKSEGLVRDIGVSNYAPELIDRLIEVSGEVPVVNQIEWSPFGYSEKMSEYCKNKDIIIQAYSPLTRNQRLDDPLLKEIGDKYEKSPAQILLRWSIQSGACPIPKANSKKHIDENIDIFDFQLSSTDIESLDNLNEKFSTFDSPLPYITE
ncbi:MAG: aldo/keto reductase [Patescibacteria group bacterium]